jgi:hypothetical protein
MLFRKIAQALPGINGNGVNDQNDQSNEYKKMRTNQRANFLFWLFDCSAKN